MRKLEKALAKDVLVLAVIPALAGITVFPGLNADTKVLPRLQVIAADVNGAPGMEGHSDEREYVADLYLGFIASAKGMSEADLDAYDERISAVQAIFEEPGLTVLKGLLNFPAEEPDNRTVPDLYLYDVRFQNQSQDPLEDKGQWQVLLHYHVEFKATDGQPPA